MPTPYRKPLRASTRLRLSGAISLPLTFLPTPLPAALDHLVVVSPGGGHTLAFVLRGGYSPRLPSTRTLRTPPVACRHAPAAYYPQKVLPAAACLPLAAARAPLPGEGGARLRLNRRLSPAAASLPFGEPTFTTYARISALSSHRGGSHTCINIPTYASPTPTAEGTANASTYSHMRPLPPPRRGVTNVFTSTHASSPVYADASKGHGYLSPRAFTRCFSKRGPYPRLHSRRGEAPPLRNLYLSPRVPRLLHLQEGAMPTLPPATVGCRRVPPDCCISCGAKRIPPIHGGPCPSRLRRTRLSATACLPLAFPGGVTPIPPLQAGACHAHASINGCYEPLCTSCLLELQEGSFPRLLSLRIHVLASTGTAACPRLPLAHTFRRESCLASISQPLSGLFGRGGHAHGSTPGGGHDHAFFYKGDRPTLPPVAVAWAFRSSILGRGHIQALGGATPTPPRATIACRHAPPASYSHDHAPKYISVPTATRLPLASLEGDHAPVSFYKETMSTSPPAAVACCRAPPILSSSAGAIPTPPSREEATPTLPLVWRATPTSPWATVSVAARLPLVISP